MLLRYGLFSSLVLLMFACSQRPEQSYQGYVEGDFVYVSSSQSGRLDRLGVSRGQSVEQNTSLFVLESENEAAAQRQAAQQLAQAKALLDDLKTGKRAPELEVTRAQLAQAQAEAKRAAAQFARDKAQAASDFISQAALDNSRATMESTAAQVRQLSSAVDVAKLAGREAQIAAQAAQVAAASELLAQANWRLAQKGVAAPRSGLIVDTLYREGEWVAVGAPVVKLLPPNNVKVRFFIPQTDLGKLELGMKVSIQCDGCKTQVLGAISYISNQAEYTPPIIYSNQTRSKLVFMLEATPEAGREMLLKPGQPVTVKTPS